jgi:hypothetical protein
MRCTLPALFACVALAAGCEQGSGSLAVDLRTDLVPGVEFIAARTEILPPGQLGPGAVGDPSVSTPATTIDRYALGVRIAELSGLPLGTRGVRVRLVDASGATVVERVTLVPIEARSIVTIVITRDCRGVSCPRPADPAGATTCLGGRCVSPECRDTGDPFSCGAYECTSSAECIGDACADWECTAEGYCFSEAHRDRCPPGFWCNPDLGCLPTGMPPGDAGPLDAGPVIGSDAGAIIGTDAGRDAGRDAGPIGTDAGPCLPGCSDGNPCTADGGCLGRCVFTPTPGAGCDDGDPCTDPDACDGSGGCGGPPRSCGSDGDPCTRDDCDRGYGGCFPPEPDMTVCGAGPRYRCCGGSCVDTRNPPNCGACYNDCRPSGLRCCIDTCLPACP